MAITNNQTIIRRMLTEHIAPYRRKIAFAGVFMLLSGAMTALFASLMQPVIDEVLAPKNNTTVLPIIAGVFLTFVLRGIGGYVSAVKMIEVGQGIVADIQIRLFGKFLTQDLAYFQKHVSGELQSRLLNDVGILRVAVVDTMLGLGLSALTVVGLLGVMIYQDWRLTLVCCFLIPVIVYTMTIIGKRLRKVSRHTQDAHADISAHVLQVFQGIRQVKSFTAEGVEDERTSRKLIALRDLNIKATRISNLALPINDTLAGLAIVGLLGYGSWAVTNSALSAGELLSFITAFLMAYEPIKKLAKLNATLQVGIGASERVFAMLDEMPNVISLIRPSPMPTAPFGLTLENVSFWYRDPENAALSNVNLHIKAGEKVALVGPSGGGKTTIMNLLPRFFDPNEGRVMVNGVDIRTLDINDWRGQTALVSQDITLFNDTVAGNIAYGIMNARREDVIRAAKAAHAHDFIMDMPEGYDTIVGENAMRLSGGQRQRLAIARAIYKNAPILLMDEATSALDPESESLIQKSLATFTQNRTVLVIAHRLSTIQSADRIVVVKDGRIAEEGTHQTLMTKGGVYAQMHQ